MMLRRATLLLPCHGWDDFPTHLGNQAAAELLAAWTTLWHPALLAATGQLPGWHRADDPPDPATLEGELVLVPRPSRDRMPSDWCDRLKDTAPRNPAPVETAAGRQETLAAVLAAAAAEPNPVEPEFAADFLALGYAYLMVELLTRAMRYSSVLNMEQFTGAVVAAARAAVAGNRQSTSDELARAFDLLTDARNHVYSVDFYIIDLSLLADTTLGESLRAKLAAQCPMNLLISGEQIERLAAQHPASHAQLQQALAAGTAAIIGGRFTADADYPLCPEALLADLRRGQHAAQQHLGREFEVFGQFAADLSPFLPEVLKQLGFRGALHAAFDGTRLAQADQRKTNWGADNESSLETLVATPLDATQPETWLKLAERIGDSLARDHVATILLAGWPGAECEYFDDLRRCAKFGTVLGKLLTLDEYFRITRQADDWVRFHPREFPNRAQAVPRPDVISTSIERYRSNVRAAHRQIGGGLAALAGLVPHDGTNSRDPSDVVINSWNFETSYLVDADPLITERSLDKPPGTLLPDVLGCGYRALEPPVVVTPVALAEGLTLRNERLELVVSKKTGGIQALRMHRDRGTRVSQRLVFHQPPGSTAGESQMVAGRVEITRNDACIGEITSSGRLLDLKGRPLANFTQRIRVARGIAPIIVDVELEPHQLPEGRLWESYIASRLAWADDALAMRRGYAWRAQETERELIESPEWVEIDDVIGRVTLFALGLPYHRRAAPNWLDTLLVVGHETGRRFQFAIGLDSVFPSQAAVGLATCGQPYLATMPGGPPAPRGWFLHVAGKNALVTRLEPLAAPATGIRLRLLETEGRDSRTSVSAFRPFRNARLTDFRGQPIEVLSVTNGAAQVELGPHRWLQIEAEW